ncbi:MAG: glycosyltransferase family 2 protein [Luteolibacter sp.]
MATDSSPSPRFSIITICLNEAEGIRRTCESIEAQTYRNFEWVVVDGGSTDGTLEILETYKHQIQTFVSGPDGGIYEAMNKGLALASGDYMLFMNGGDSFASEDVLQKVSDAPPKDLIYGDVYLGHARGNLATYPDVMSRGYLLRNMVPHQATFYRRTLFEQYGNYDTRYRIAGDYELYIRLLEVHRVSYHHIAKPLAVFDLGGISASKRHRILRKQENHAIRMKHFPRYRWSPKAWRQSLRNLMKAGKP